MWGRKLGESIIDCLLQGPGFESNLFQEPMLDNCFNNHSSCCYARILVYQTLLCTQFCKTPKSTFSLQSKLV